MGEQHSATATGLSGGMASIINFAQYPLDDLNSDTGRALVERCRDEVRRTGACLLPDFITPEARDAWLSEAGRVEGKAHQVDHDFTYGAAGEKTAEPPASLPEDDPRNYLSHTAMKFVAKDLIGDGCSIKDLHRWEPMAAFIRQVMERPAYPSGCPLSGLVFTIAYDGEEQDWHFDNNDFIVTLMLQKPAEGGHFEYMPGLRTPEGEDDFETIKAVHKGTCPDVIRPPIRPGTLTLFKGRYNYHRASPVIGNHPRVMAIFAYEREPDSRQSDAASSMLFFGRTQEQALA